MNILYEVVRKEWGHPLDGDVQEVVFTDKDAEKALRNCSLYNSILKSEDNVCYFVRVVDEDEE